MNGGWDWSLEEPNSPGITFSSDKGGKMKYRWQSPDICKNFCVFDQQKVLLVSWVVWGCVRSVQRISAGIFRTATRIDGRAFTWRFPGNSPCQNGRNNSLRQNCCYSFDSLLGSGFGHLIAQVRNTKACKALLLLWVVICVHNPHQCQNQVYNMHPQVLWAVFELLFTGR